MDAKTKKRATLVIIAVAIIALLGAGLLLGSPSNILQLDDQTKTQYGESLDLTLEVGGETYGATWLPPGSFPKGQTVVLVAVFNIPIRVLISANASQNFYTVNNTYYSQQKISYSIDISVTGSQVQSVKLANLTLKAVDNADGSTYLWLTVLNTAINLPYTNNWNGWQYISDHLGNAQASTSDATIKYLIYCKVTATGSVSGQQLVAQTAGGSFAQFKAYHYVYSSEQAGTTVTPSVSPSSWLVVFQVGIGAIIAVELLIIAFLLRRFKH